ncbi:MAG: VanZ family protein [Candidatus Omnitrophica bacterium]|nr:VanZ family protein [Candidatus Omnitrophota bacterium]MBU1871749.1 VanZ family protein [Candidatus Omnitrophota bacterium]
MTKPIFIYWLPVALWAILIFAVSGLPGEDLPYVFSGQDLFFHVMEYAVLALLLNRALSRTSLKSYPQKKKLLLVIMACLIYAISDEFHQKFVPGRVASLADILLDGLGIVIGGIAYRGRN